MNDNSKNEYEYTCDNMFHDYGSSIHHHHHNVRDNETWEDGVCGKLWEDSICVEL